MCTSDRHHASARASAEPWARGFFARMLAGMLETGEFEEAVRSHWSGEFIVRAPGTAAWLRDLALGPAARDAGYAMESPHLGFRSQWLVGTQGRPGAIHIQAPAEGSAGAALSRLNREPHQHDSGRIALITRGRAIFHARRQAADGQPVIVDCPVVEGDLLFWPAWTPHTFDACEGFCLVSAMALYVSPAEDGFVFPLGEAGPHPDELPRMRYEQWLEAAR